MTKGQALARVRDIIERLRGPAPLSLHVLGEISELEMELDYLEAEAAKMIDGYMARQFQRELDTRREKSA